ncbi:hypothetical protein Tco_0821691 [Tanacetum coccineum]|uniref:Uncharacterized protein n=1 Tax=Tanacetum coccineum TaxID=301880 RepID=A0ABQ5AG37_9ASTR
MQNYTRYDAQSFYEAMIFNMDSLRKYMLELILHQQRTPQLLKQKKLMQTQEDHSNPIPALNVDSLKVDLVVIQNTCSEKEDSNSETASSKLVKECSLNSETKDVHAIKYKMSKAKERCMAYFRSLHSHLQVLSKDDLKGTRIEHGFKRAFMSLFGQDVDTFTRTMLLNVDQLQKQLDKDEFQEDGSMMDSPFGSGNDTDSDDADIRPIYDEEPMVEVQLTAECNIFAIGQQHIEQPQIIVEDRVDWIPTGKLFDSCTSKVDSEPPHGSNIDIPNIHECKQSLDVSAGTSINVQKEQSLDLSAEVHQAAKIVTMSNELDLLFGPLFDEYFNGENQVVIKSSAVTTTDASNKHQQLPDSASSTSTLATTVTANGNFDL